MTKKKQRRLPPDESRGLKLQYGIWLGIPQDARSADERTQKQLAAKWGVTALTLSRWLKDPLVTEIKEHALHQLISNKYSYEIWKTVAEKALGGNVTAARLFGEYTGDIGKTSTHAAPQQAIQFNISVEEATPEEIIGERAEDKTAPKATAFLQEPD